MKNFYGFLVICLLSVFSQLNAQTTFHIYPRGYDTICPGDSVRVEAILGYNSYHWSTGQTVRFITIKTAGKYVCTVTDSNSHSYKDSIIVVLYPAKTLHISTNPSPAVLCKGSLLSIEASMGFKSYHWSNSESGRLLQLHPSISGLLTLEATDSNGCSKKESLHIIVNNCDSCHVQISASPRQKICHSGDTIILEANMGFTAYHWSNGHHDRIIKVTQPGKYIVEVTDSNGKHCKDSIEIGSGSKSLHLSSNPSPAVVCPGDVVILEASSGFALYDWNIDGSGHRIEYTATVSKRVVLHATDSNGCTSEAVVEVTVRDTCPCRNLISPHPKSMLCGDHDSLYLEGKSGYKRYSWNTGNHDRTILVKTAGWYKIEVMDSNGNVCHDSIHITKTILPQLTVSTNPSPAIVCKGQKLILEASNGFKYYNWSNGKTTNRIEIFPEHSFQLVLEAQTESGCVVRKEIHIIVDTCSSVFTDVVDYHIQVYPNPLSGSQLTVSASGANIHRLRIFDPAGKLVYHVENLQNDQVEVSLPEISHGLYLLEIGFSDFKVMRILMIE